PSSLACLSGYREEGGLFITTVHDVATLNFVTAEITEGQGSVKKIESRYPSLEEMLIKIGK
ncbi:MAG: ABC transporter ATP-binding protein, partial [Methanogenium sp.]|nr:ABC transporter ATP-binding protein [Methanogenium sp.]